MYIMKQALYFTVRCNMEVWTVSIIRSLLSGETTVSHVKLFCRMSSTSKGNWYPNRKVVHPIPGTRAVGEPFKGRCTRSWGWQKGRWGIVLTNKGTHPCCPSRESKACPMTAAIIIQEPWWPRKMVAMWQSQDQARKMSARQGQDQQGTRLGTNLLRQGPNKDLT